MTKLAQLSEEAMRLAQESKWKPKWSDEESASALEFLGYSVKSTGDRGIYHFTHQPCSTDYYKNELLPMRERTVACIACDDTDSVSYHRVGECPR